MYATGVIRRRRPRQKRAVGRASRTARTTRTRGARASARALASVPLQRVHRHHKRRPSGRRPTFVKRWLSPRGECIRQGCSASPTPPRLAHRDLALRAGSPTSSGGHGRRRGPSRRVRPGVGIATAAADEGRDDGVEVVLEVVLAAATATAGVRARTLRQHPDGSPGRARGRARPAASEGPSRKGSCVARAGVRPPPPALPLPCVSGTAMLRPRDGTVPSRPTRRT